MNVRAQPCACAHTQASGRPALTHDHDHDREFQPFRTEVLAPAPPGGGVGCWVLGGGWVGGDRDGSGTHTRARAYTSTRAHSHTHTPASMASVDPALKSRLLLPPWTGVCVGVCECALACARVSCTGARVWRAAGGGGEGVGGCAADTPTHSPTHPHTHTPTVATPTSRIMLKSSPLLVRPRCAPPWMGACPALFCVPNACCVLRFGTTLTCIEKPWSLAETLGHWPSTHS